MIYNVNISIFSQKQCKYQHIRFCVFCQTRRKFSHVILYYFGSLPNNSDILVINRKFSFLGVDQKGENQIFLFDIDLKLPLSLS